MPRRLLDRLRPHSANEFRAAAVSRYEDGEALALAGRSTAAVYLWGYAAEMLLKAAVFEAWDYDPAETITLDDVRAAAQLAPDVGFRWPGGLHNIAAWGELLARLWEASSDDARDNGDLAGEVVIQSRRLYRTWRETLRYHKNVAYPHEVRAARDVVTWLLAWADE